MKKILITILLTFALNANAFQVLPAFTVHSQTKPSIFSLIWKCKWKLDCYRENRLGALTNVASTNQLSAFPTLYNENLKYTVETGTTSVASITTLSGLTTASALVTVGALTSGSLASGFTKITTRVPFNQATSSLCIVPKPHYATATLAFFGVVFNSAVATGAKGVDISLSIESSNDPKTLPFSTTSADVIGTYTIGRGAVNTVTASTSIGAAVNILTRTATSAFAYLLVANQAAGDYRGYAPQGFCSVEWYVH